jgi:hypothetical protein
MTFREARHPVREATRGTTPGHDKPLPSIENKPKNVRSGMLSPEQQYENEQKQIKRFINTWRRMNEIRPGQELTLEQESRVSVASRVRGGRALSRVKLGFPFHSLVSSTRSK